MANLQGNEDRVRRPRRPNPLLDWGADVTERCVYFRRSLGQLSAIVMRKVTKLIDSLPEMSLDEIENAEDEVCFSSKKYRDQLENFSAIAAQAEAQLAWDRYFEIGRQVKQALETARSRV